MPSAPTALNFNQRGTVRRHALSSRRAEAEQLLDWRFIPQSFGRALAALALPSKHQGYTLLPCVPTRQIDRKHNCCTPTCFTALDCKSMDVGEFIFVKGRRPPSTASLPVRHEIMEFRIQLGLIRVGNTLEILKAHAPLRFVWVCELVCCTEGLKIGANQQFHRMPITPQH